MDIKTVATKPIDGQKPGTSGLRKKTRVFMQPGYLENYVQAIFDGVGGVAGKLLVIGGDGRFFNDRAIQVIIKMAVANGASQLFVAVFGDAGQHVRSAVGVPVLPLDAPVEVELTVEPA